MKLWSPDEKDSISKLNMNTKLTRDGNTVQAEMAEIAQTIEMCEQLMNYSVQDKNNFFLILATRI